MCRRSSKLPSGCPQMPQPCPAARAASINSLRSAVGTGLVVAVALEAERSGASLASNAAMRASVPLMEMLSNASSVCIRSTKAARTSRAFSISAVFRSGLLKENSTQSQTALFTLSLGTNTRLMACAGWSRSIGSARRKRSLSSGKTMRATSIAVSSAFLISVISLASLALLSRFISSSPACDIDGFPNERSGPHCNAKKRSSSSCTSSVSSFDPPSALCSSLLAGMSAVFWSAMRSSSSVNGPREMARRSSCSVIGVPPPWMRLKKSM
mmetsp:Transcript_4222/g.13552  ORF Transcript_4222/g.13552 Transcript_4222/m.13552 type:complete len:269 (+) Transcript_4222:203-1009(+)